MALIISVGSDRSISISRSDVASGMSALSCGGGHLDLEDLIEGAFFFLITIIGWHIALD